jgi:hypothetical protein
VHSPGVVALEPPRAVRRAPVAGGCSVSVEIRKIGKVDLVSAVLLGGERSILLAEDPGPPVVVFKSEGRPEGAWQESQVCVQSEGAYVLWRSAFERWNFVGSDSTYQAPIHAFR